MTELVLIRVGVPRGTAATTVWEALTAQPSLAAARGARLYRPTRGFFEPTEWVYAAEIDEPLGPIVLPADTLQLRKFETYPFREDINPYRLTLLGSSMPIQLVTITVLPPKIEEFERWYSAHASILSQAPGATGALRYWQDGEPRRYASVYYYESAEGVERYYQSDTRAAAALDRLRFDPWLVDQHHAYYEDITPV
ncbi:MAG: hypothetical protein NZ518_04300 [Dehalococcoidia bacterium]|nr:hypothetical protein [Dehalococcoidia bacterium]